MKSRLSARATSLAQAVYRRSVHQNTQNSAIISKTSAHQCRSIKTKPSASWRHRRPHQDSQSHSTPKTASSSYLTLFAALAVAAGFGSSSWHHGIESKIAEGHRQQSPVAEAGSTPLREEFRLEDVAKHDRTADRKWVVSGTKVFDITDFVEAHPGGEVILRACGGCIDAYWNIFTIHQKPEVRAILNEYYIGDVSTDDLNATGDVDWARLRGQGKNEVEDPFCNDPVQDEKLIFHTEKPCNAETPSDLLTKWFITPVQHFFVRNHFWVPDIDPKQHQVIIEFSDGEEAAFSLADLKTRFRPCTITATLQCSGNRRAHMSATPPPHGKTSGLAWDVGAISTAEFTGARLQEVLASAGIKESASDTDAHVHFISPGDAYSTSIPLQTALSPQSDVLLAYEMNGEALNRTHGGPLRAVVPGVTAARSVKWVGRVSVSDEESESQWQRRDYKVFPPHVKASEVKIQDWDALPSIQETPVQSAITSVRRSSPSQTNDVHVSGYAFSGGGRAISRVDVSNDGGSTWKQAKLKSDDAKGSKRWAWTLWDVGFEQSVSQKDAGARTSEFVVRAVDEAGNTQPATFEGTWNFRGLLANAWHRVMFKSSDA
jgi:sulfite oxidase